MTFHDQYMAVAREVSMLPDGPDRAALEGLLYNANELINEQNHASVRRVGGELLRTIASATRTFRVLA